MDKGQITISEKNKKELDFYPPSTWPVTFFVVLMLVSTALVGGGLTLLKNQQMQQYNDLNQKAKTIEQQMQQLDKDKGLLTTSKKLNAAVKTYSDYIKADLNWQQFLTKVKDMTLKEVTYTAFAIDRSKKSFRVDGVAPSYRIVAEQLNTLSKDKNFDEVKMKSTILRPQSPENSRVAFSFEIKPKDTAFQTPKKENSSLDLITDKNKQLNNLNNDNTLPAVNNQNQQ